MTKSSDGDAFNYKQLDPGIRDIVRELRGGGWETTDSGDGKSKPAVGRNFGDLAHVVIQVTTTKGARETLLEEAHRLYAWMSRAEGAKPALKGWRVEASYDPAEWAGLLIVTWPGPL